MTKEEFRIKVIASRRKYLERQKRIKADADNYMFESIRKVRKQSSRARHASQNPN